ncbi:MAG: tetratricopeptide repeat protein [SAR324 cluster bacterium]|nr:tetratricopeptide repeat protein [SAR324 cluster bacterium]
MLQIIRDWFNQSAIKEATEVLKHQVNQELAENELESAEKTLNKILELSPDEEDALVTLSKLLMQQKKVDEGYQFFQKAVSLNAQNARFAINFVEAYEALGNSEKMQEVLYAAIQKAPDMLDLRLYLAQQLFENAMIQEAESELTEILKRDPDHREANIGLAHCHINTGRKSQALEQVNKIRQWDAKEADALISAIYENVQNFN